MPNGGGSRHIFEKTGITEFSQLQKVAGSVGASCGHTRAGQRREREGGANWRLQPRSLAFYLFASRWVSHLVTE